MYGLLHRVLEDLVTSKYSLDAWLKILEIAGFDYKDSPVISSTKYDDSVTSKLCNATCKVLDISSDYLLDVLGDYFLIYSQNAGYDKLLKCLGGTFPDAIMSFDTMVDHLESHYPGIQHPTLHAEILDETSMRIIYFSSRTEYSTLMRSILRAYAREIFNLKIEVKEEPRKDKSNGVIFKVQCAEDEEKTLSSVHDVCSRSRMSRNPKKLPISPALFREMHPFHLMMKSKDFEVIQLGNSLNKVLRQHLKRLPKKFHFYDLFTVLKPESKATKCYDVQLNRTYIVETNFPVLNGRDAGIIAAFRRNSQGHLRLKGQVIEVDSETVMMLATPQIYTFQELGNFGMFESDIPLHDSLRNILFMNSTKEDSKDLIKKLEEGSNHLKSLDSQLRIDKMKTENVLHALLPAKIARRLCMNLPVEAEVHSEVTCLFTDIVGFTEMCGRPTTLPMDIVRTLNALYSDYDEVLNDYGLYKVETIGDAYMAVCGLQNQVPDHADRTVLMALKLVEKTKTVSKEVLEFDIQVRVGIHSGPVVAGVVGVKMPRYCLFGHTVTLANLIESWSKASKVNISYMTKRYMQDRKKFTFTRREETKGTVCYFVDLRENSSKQMTPQSTMSDTASSSSSLVSDMTDDELEYRASLGNEDIDCCLLEEILSLSISSSSAGSLFKSRQKTSR